MALFFECMPKCVRKVLDTADIVRDDIVREETGFIVNERENGIYRQRARKREKLAQGHLCARPIIALMNRRDLVQLWEEHTRHEFATRDTDTTLATMVNDAYVNHIPVMTGGYGKDALRRFYSRDFIPTMPADTTLTSISRTVGEDQIVDEMIFSFTHTQEMPWMLPGIAPTNRRVEVPLVAVVHFRDDKLAHEHIYWDQASVLKQIGLLEDPKLPVFG